MADRHYREVSPKPWTLPATPAATIAPPAAPPATTNVELRVLEGDRAPDGQRLRRVRYRTCPGADLVLFVAVDVDGALDRGVPRDAWWVSARPTCPIAPCARDGAPACGRCCATVCRQRRVCPPPPRHRRVHRRRGVAAARALRAGGAARRRQVLQFKRNSGVCWYASLVWTSFTNPLVRGLITSRMDAETRRTPSAAPSTATPPRPCGRRWVSLPHRRRRRRRPAQRRPQRLLQFLALCGKLGVLLVVLEDERQAHAYFGDAVDRDDTGGARRPSPASLTCSSCATATPTTV